MQWLRKRPAKQTRTPIISGPHRPENEKLREAFHYVVGMGVFDGISVNPFRRTGSAADWMTVGPAMDTVLTELGRKKVALAVCEPDQCFFLDHSAGRALVKKYGPRLADTITWDSLIQLLLEGGFGLAKIDSIGGRLRITVL